jgi:hypothetical protein
MSLKHKRFFCCLLDLKLRRKKMTQTKQDEHKNRQTMAPLYIVSGHASLDIDSEEEGITKKKATKA